jgi:hypothetical protein
MEISHENAWAGYLQVVLLKIDCDFYREVDQETQRSTSRVLEDILQAVMDNVLTLLEYREKNIAMLDDISLAWEYFVHRYQSTGAAGFDASLYFDDDPDNASYVSTMEQSDDKGSEDSTSSNMVNDQLSSNISSISKISSQPDIDDNFDSLSIGLMEDDDMNCEGAILAMEEQHDNYFHKAWFACLTGRRSICGFTATSLDALEAIIEDNIITSYRGNPSW